MNPPRLTKAECAAHLGSLYNEGGRPFSDRALTKWQRHCQLPHFKVGSRVMFDREAVERWAERRWRRNQFPQWP